MGRARAENSPFLNVVALFSIGIRVMLPCIITGAYAFSTTTAGELVCALRSMHVPESVIIPCAVVIRFFPTVGEDYRQIRAAMRCAASLRAKRRCCSTGTIAGVHPDAAADER